MSYLVRGPAERGAGAPRLGMRPWSKSQGACNPAPYARLRGQIPSKLGPLFRPPMRPPSAGIDSKANAARRRPGTAFISIYLAEAAA